MKTKNIMTVISLAIISALHIVAGGVQTTLWGPNGMMDFHEPYEESDDNIWIYGEGIHAELEP